MELWELVARESIRDCIARGESPYASHQMLTEALDDTNPIERNAGIQAGLAWRHAAARTGQVQRYIWAVVALRQRPSASNSRGEPSMAASVAPAAPTPCPAMMSILTPASWSARNTPAWYAPWTPVPHSTSAVRRSGEYCGTIQWLRRGS